MSMRFRKVYFVRPDGSDDNDGVQDDPSRAFRSVQRAIDATFEVLARPTSAVTIRIAHGSYSGGIDVSGSVPARPDRDGFLIRFIGDEQSPDKVELEVTGSDAVRVSDGASILVAGMTLRTHGSGNLLTAIRRATLGHRNCILGTSPSETIHATRYAEVCAMGPTTVAGSSVAFAHATIRSTISFTRESLIFREGVHFARYLWGVNDSTVKLDQCRIIGHATGDIGVHINGVLNVSSVVGEWRGGTEPRLIEGGLITYGKLPARTLTP